MKIYVTIHDQEFEVELERLQGGRSRVRLGDRVFEVDLSTIERSRRYSILLDQESHDVTVDAKDGKLQLIVGGRRVDARVEDERQRSARAIAGQAPKGPLTVLSVMPGILREVRVEVGQAVEVGQTLVILEAMKMENEIAAEQAGVISEVFASSGMAVDGGAPLLVIVPPAEPAKG